MTTKNDPLIGTTYDNRYRIERRIGAGGMANVYLAQDETLGRRVAIKVLHQRYAEDSQFVERFLREASAAARLSHPNIVQVYDRGQAGGSYYIAMEYVDGLTLKDLIRRRGGLSEPEVLAYGRQALHALRSAHRNGIVHRDIKPHNMMVDTDGRLKIADFGIARAAADADQGLTEAGSIVGTAQYLSPEQAQGMEVSAASDLYSLGVVMFEMATGSVPFDGDSPVNIALKHVKDEPPRPNQRGANISPALESIIMKALQKDPSARYHTADDMLADLDLAREGSQTSAMTQVLGGAASANTALDQTQVTPASAAAAAARYNTPPVPPEPVWQPDWESGDSEDEDKAKRSIWRWLLPLLIVLALAATAAFLLLRDQTKMIAVPDVVGQSIKDARATIEDAGFVVGKQEREFSDSEPIDTVLKQTPDGASKAKEGSKIDLVISNGTEPVAVPNVVGKTRKEAFELLREAGFKPKEGERESSDDVKKGYVLKQNPAADAEVDPGSEVVLTLSSGPEKTEVPNVVGKTFNDAKAELEKAGFKVNNPIEQDSSQPAQTVLSQDPSAGSELETDGEITLTVASGSNNIPAVTGTAQEQAEEKLRSAGFSANIVTEEVTDTAQIGVVISTNPKDGARTKLGTAVTLVIGMQSISNDEPAGGEEPPVG